MTTAASGPKRVGRYQILDRIPGGGMTEVYRARVAEAQGPERPLVLKLLPREQGADLVAKARFVEEAKIALALAHGNIVSTFEAGRDEDGHLFLVMEYVQGCSLRELLGRGGALGLTPALFIAREIARALRYTHCFTEPGGTLTPLAHLDVSPENVLLSLAGQVKLTDFGIARAVGAGRRSGGTYGKAAYVAPEILEGAQGDPRADLYGLGVLLYEMLSGRSPHHAATQTLILERVRHHDHYPPLREAIASREGLPEQVEQLVDELLAWDPARRQRGAGEVEVCLSRILATQERSFTEPELAHILEERGVEAKSSGVNAARLVAQLSDDGPQRSSTEGTLRLLEEGTVPLDPVPSAVAIPEGGPATAQASEAAEAAESAVARPLAGRFSPLYLGSLVVVLLLGLLAYVGTRPPAGRGSVSQSKAQIGTPRRIIPEETQDLVPVANPPPALRAASRLLGSTKEPLRASVGRPVERHPRDRPALRPKPRGAEGSGGSGVATAEEETQRVLPLKQAPALLKINAFPYAVVRDAAGKTLGTTPIRALQLTPGVHRLHFVNEELKLDRWVSLELAPGEERTLGVRLDRAPEATNPPVATP